MEIYFQIATDQGPRQVSGHVYSRESLIGIHRLKEEDDWTVTFLPTGTKCDSVFPERMYANQNKMLRRLQEIEEAALPAWLGISILPFGTQDLPEWCEPLFAEIRRAAGL